MDNLEINNEQKAKVTFFKSKKFLIILAIFVIGVGIGGYFVREHNLEVKAKEQAKKEKEYINLLKETTENINTMYKAQQILSKLNVEVWNATIENDLFLKTLAKYLSMDEATVLENSPKDRIRTNSFRGDYIRKGDFNTGLAIIRNLAESQGNIKKIEEKNELIIAQLGKLKNRPDKYKDIYNELLDFYGIYEKYSNLALTPKGSYLTYTRDINSLSTELESQYNKIKVSMPE